MFIMYNPETVRSKDTCADEERNGISSTMGLMKMMGLRNSTKHDDRHQNLRVSLPVHIICLFANSILSLSFLFI